MDEELFDLPDLPAELIAAARLAIGVPGVNGGPAVPYKTPILSSFNTLVGGGFIFAQPIPSATWAITHNLNRFPQVTVVDSTGRQLEADVTYINANTVWVSGVVAFAGTAYLI